MSCPVDLISTAAAISKSAVQVSETQTLFEKNLNSNSEVTFRIVMILEKWSILAKLDLILIEYRTSYP